MDLYLFNQFSGQCWSDAVTVLLLFSSELGKKTQEKLRLSDEALMTDFNSFCNRYRQDIHEIAGYPISVNDFKEFKTKAFTYLRCVKKRFANWKLRSRQPEGARPPLQRCDSVIISLCQETAGAEANEMLYQPIPSEEKMRQMTPKEQRATVGLMILQPYLFRQEIKKVEAARSTRELVNVELAKPNRVAENYKDKGFSDVRGYSSIRLGKLIAVLIHYLFQSDNFVTVPFEEEKYESISRNNYRNGVNTIPSPFAFFYRDWKPKEKLNPFIPTILHKKLLQALSPSIKVSCQVSVEFIKRIPGQSNLELGGHAVTFLDCEGGRFIYDDNYKKLVNLDWRSFLMRDAEDDRDNNYAHTDTANYYYIYSPRGIMLGFYSPKNGKFILQSAGDEIKESTPHESFKHASHEERFFHLQKTFPRIAILSSINFLFLDRRAYLGEKAAANAAAEAEKLKVAAEAAPAPAEPQGNIGGRRLRRATRRAPRRRGRKSRVRR